MNRDAALLELARAYAKAVADELWAEMTSPIGIEEDEPQRRTEKGDEHHN